MTAIHETAYPRIKPSFTNKEMVDLFTPTLDEMALIKSKTKSTLHSSRLGFAIILKCYQYLGKPIQPRKICYAIISHIANCLNLSPEVDLKQYPKSTRKRHINLIRVYLQISANKNDRRLCMKKSALDAAKSKENLADIINNVIEDLTKSKFELPSYSKLLRLAKAARKVTNYSYFREIVNMLSVDQKKYLDGLLVMNSIKEATSWALIKKNIKKRLLIM